jgi:hypothetical protein
VARFEDQFPPLPGHPPRLEQPSASPWPRRTAVVRGALGVAAALLLLVVVLFVPRLLLDWDLASAPVGDRAKAVNDIRTGLLQAVGGLVVVVGAVLTWRQLQVNRAGQVTEAFASAITHLGDPSVDVRLGGIYALERIARTSGADRQGSSRTASSGPSSPCGLELFGTPSNERPAPGLAERTRPGPFRPRTHELGTYLGVREGGTLVAMAGERLRPPGWTRSAPARLPGC